MRDATEPFLPKITITLVLIGFIVWYFANEDDGEYNYGDNVFYNSNNNDSKTYNETKINYRNYCYQTDMDAYNRITKENTDRELEKLYESKQFKDMYCKKGENLNNWNWQSRERNNNYCLCF